jgi:hypothetical protein
MLTTEDEQRDFDSEAAFWNEESGRIKLATDIANAIMVICLYWFEGKKLNVSYDCMGKHLEKKTKASIAIQAIKMQGKPFDIIISVTKMKIINRRNGSGL